MSPTNLIASLGKPRSSMVVRSRVWSIDPNALRKCMLVMYISCDVCFASSRAAISICICRVVLHCGRNPSWL